MIVHLNAISRFLNHVVCQENLNKEDCQLIYECFVGDLIQQLQVSDLSARDALSIAMIIVGAKVIDMFHMVSCIMTLWEPVDGAYWIIQLEFVRHLLLYSIRHNKSFYFKDFKTYFGHLQNHTTIHRKLIELFSNFDSFFQLSFKEQAIFLEEYEDKYPLDMFIDWFLRWSKEKLIHYSKIVSITTNNNDNNNITNNNAFIHKRIITVHEPIKEISPEECIDEVNFFDSTSTSFKEITTICLKHDANPSIVSELSEMKDGNCEESNQTDDSSTSTETNTAIHEWKKEKKEEEEEDEDKKIDESLTFSHGLAKALWEFFTPSLYPASSLSVTTIFNDQTISDHSSDD